jgi:phospholipid/cholesterol/gamma-HCH transport system substrate-binding protein
MIERRRRRRNIYLGVFVIISLAALAGMILKLTDITTRVKKGYDVKLHMADSDGVLPGQPVRYLGVIVGAVSDLRFTRDSQGIGQGVEITLHINSDVQLPSNGLFTVSAGGIGLGGVYLDIVLPKLGDGKTAPPGSPVPHDGTAELVVSSSPSLMDKIDEVVSKFNDLGKVVKNIEEMTTPRTLADVQSGQKAPNLSSAIARLDHTLAEFGADENAAHLRETLKNLAASSAKLDKTLESANTMFGKASVTLDKVGSDFETMKDKTGKLLDKLNEDSDKVSKLLDTFNSLAQGVQDGQGTVGKLLKDDGIAKSLELLILQMNATVKDADRLIIKLEEQGILRKGG